MITSRVVQAQTVNIKSYPFESHKGLQIELQYILLSGSAQQSVQQILSFALPQSLPWIEWANSVYILLEWNS